ncbi:hypothetical protein [Methylobacterium pseudosasicola]|uniref:Uncharacterized protein n=1 Tax=Methylobacterium pseudosasicola TaxID=582667 RepID=A0A1I4TZH3_9HYPH|nr:hypothetical protein [Methylobacterium pseudosasicola]SFM82208.1 hypothetical protein SAMN05192568_10615 [Methylobacterium pseudosasicola]
MSESKEIEVRFYLVGGQTVSVPMELEDGTVLTQEALHGFIKDWKKIGQFSYATTAFAIAIPDMENVAMIEARPIPFADPA